LGLTAVERLTVWMAGRTWLRRVMVIVLALPVAEIFASYQRHPVTGFLISAVSMFVGMVGVERMWRVDLTADEERRVTEAQLTGRSTGDRRLDGWAAHRAGLAASRRNTHGTGLWWSAAFIASVLVAIAVMAAVRSSPWWLLCLTLAPLYLAGPIAFAQSDADAAAELLDEHETAGD